MLLFVIPFKIMLSLNMTRILMRTLLLSLMMMVMCSNMMMIDNLEDEEKNVLNEIMFEQTRCMLIMK